MLLQIRLNAVSVTSSIGAKKSTLGFACKYWEKKFKELQF